MVSWQWTSWAVSELSSLFHWSVCSFLCQYMQLRLLEIYNAILKLGIVMIPAFFLLNTASDIQGLWGLQCCCAFFFSLLLLFLLKIPLQFWNMEHLVIFILNCLLLSVWVEEKALMEYWYILDFIINCLNYLFAQFAYVWLWLCLILSVPLHLMMDGGWTIQSLDIVW